jgi:hypothetical protein
LLAPPLVRPLFFCGNGNALLRAAAYASSWWSLAIVEESGRAPLKNSAVACPAR